MIVEAHGGVLIDRLLTGGELARRNDECDELPTITPTLDELYDAEKIGLGAYSPLDRFQGGEELASVLASGRLPNGLPWTIPIVLAPRGRANARAIESLRLGDDVVLREASGKPVAILHVEEKAQFSRSEFASSVYGTTDTRHPNVADLARCGEVILSGPVELLCRLDRPSGRLELSPEEAREEFSRRGWKNVAAYQTRNVPHLAHEYLQRCTLEREEIDGLFIHPVVGRLKAGDYRPEVIVDAYRTLIRSYYPSDRVVLGTLGIAMRYAGPKAALFLAIVRKNFGCSHYVVGRDQAGVGGFYDPLASQRIFDEYDIGVTPLRFAETFLCRACRAMATSRTCPHAPESRVRTSQTRIRDALARGEPLPEELLRPEVVRVLGGSGEALVAG